MMHFQVVVKKALILTDEMQHESKPEQSLFRLFLSFE